MKDESRLPSAWIRGVKLAGPVLFGDGGDPELARKKWDLRPNPKLVEDPTGMSGGEATFPSAMYPFFNYTDDAPMLGAPTESITPWRSAPSLRGSTTGAARSSPSYS